MVDIYFESTPIPTKDMIILIACIIWIVIFVLYFAAFAYTCTKKGKKYSERLFKISIGLFIAYIISFTSILAFA